MSIRVQRKGNARHSQIAEQRVQRALGVEKEEAQRVSNNSARLRALRLAKKNDPKG